MDLKYGEDYPESCPPGSASPVEGCYYRLCDSNPPTDKDFKTHVDLGLNFPPKKLCEAKALSFMSSMKSATNMQNRFPRLKKKFPVLVNLVPLHGIGLEAGEHLNLWEYCGLNLLECIGKGEDNEAS